MRLRGCEPTSTRSATSRSLPSSTMLTRELPGVRVSYGVILPTVLTLAGIILFLGRLALKAQRIRPVTGAEGLVGEHGRTLSSIAPSRPGQVRVHGELWRATSATSLDGDCQVRVVAVDGLTLRVVPARSLTGEGGVS